MVDSEMGEKPPSQIVVGSATTGQVVRIPSFYVAASLNGFVHRSALCYGRSSYIHHSDWDVPLPPVEDTNDFAFVALCELTVILDRILRHLHVVRPSHRPNDTREILTTISKFGLELDTWKHRLDAMGQSLNGYFTPGFRMSLLRGSAAMFTRFPGSLQLSYLAVALLLARSVLDLDLPLAAAHSAYDSGLRVTQEVVAFTSSLTPDDLRGYFAACELQPRHSLKFINQW
jgi:hypothetical protein